MIYALKEGQEKITVLREGRFVQILPKDIYYFEAVDNKVFVYLEKDVYECKHKLYELEQPFAETDFFRATKSTIVNLSRVKSLSPAFNGRFELLMKNEEKLIVSRQYVPGLKAKRGMPGMRKIRFLMRIFTMVMTGVVFAVGVFTMVLSIALIFAAISLITWRKSAADAARMNKKLEEYRKKIGEGNSEE